MIVIVITANSSSLSQFPGSHHRSCPEEYRELRRRQDEMSFESTTDDNDNDDDDDDINGSETRENVCEQAMTMIVRRHDFVKLDPTILLNYCPHYNERLALAKENNDTLCENKKQQLNMKRKRQQLKKKRDDSNDFDDDDDDDYKRRALLRRELKKRVALRFIRKRKL
ncbi:unnamed protein product [Adineta steineri]|uniref:Uncharacterized protein n=1 Tax=Adineta steineri TaxID=433720 RepID=A0A814P3Y9_9BILA|nr:unnamed protein product [Adineta steineri]